MRRWNERRSLLLVASLLAAIAAIGYVVATRGSDDGTKAPVGGDRLIMWAGCERVAALSDDDLDHLHDLGVDGFVCMGDRLAGLGGSQDFADADADLDGDNYSLERSLRDSDVIARAADRGMKVYLGVKLANYQNTATPLVDWFDDAGWSDQVLPKLHDIAAAAQSLGCAGIAFDQEMYPQTGGVQTATWAWDYPGNSHTESEVRAAATERGKQVMTTLTDAFPDLELAVYHYAFPDDWEDLVRSRLRPQALPAAETLHTDFWDGMTSIDGYGAIRFWDNTFYKEPAIGTWDSALAYNQNETYALFSRRFSNWAYASDRVFVSPFAWINAGPNSSSTYDDARPPDYVSAQLLAFRRWADGGEFANFVYGGLLPEQYDPYADAMRTASAPGDVDQEVPTIAETDTDPGVESISGTAHDNRAVKVVRWRDDDGDKGVASLNWAIVSGDVDDGFEWKTTWSVPAQELSAGATEVTVTAEDMAGNVSEPATVTIP